ncbi:MAG: SusC/RagA family TonB-linked outer membrane protein [Prevotella sp.]|jgi:TonB-linked SusC/RagA family outer membrane protein|nr:SusC/RagA family TonB-linked outer membrane protein [Prevotella sp.]MCI1684881.1 SusC/RagA family TonB-linked outer membrane protein [Prevotella sp.]MCI1780288.1 SusC/RagA family TonB-linked outer membrane protein [Prevotella sp.]MCI1802113.1 SusC/RagA family TonB-linked outer membrane protein [Prevotella sp.]MCI1817232.1 SusC/RagA family TonB-linked outer membrane protein [Prevotella sp.]MCI1847790.1 SusC/RagA family TonB-linked outer membrane protein [Prevotella sp.]
MGKRLMMFLACLFLSVGMAMAQTNVSGTVLSQEDGGPIVGAAVVAVGTKIGTVTDVNGNFSLSVPANSRLEISYIGMVSQKVIAKGKSINVVLQPDNKNLDEVVVVAYGTAKRQSITGSVAVVDSKKIEDRISTSVTSALEGSAPGVQVNNSYGEPGTEPTIHIRGVGTLVKDADQPLYVVDGVPYEGNISELNPNDIESMSVLKDASSAALYGNRAANGVILITTKRARYASKPILTLNINQGVYERGIGEYERLGANQWMEASWKAMKNYALSGGIVSTESDAATYATQHLIGDYARKNIYNEADNQLFDSNGNLTGTMNPNYNDLDWEKAVERTGYRQEYNASAGVSGEKFNVYTSAGYLKEDGYAVNSGFERFTGRINSKFNATNWLEVGLNLSGASSDCNFNSDANGSLYSNPFYVTRYMAPVYSYYLHNADGTYALDTNGNKQYDTTSSYLDNRNIAYEMRTDKDKNRRNVLDGIAYAKITLPYGFGVTLNTDLSNSTSNREQYNNPNIGDGATNNGRLSEYNYRYTNITGQELLTWNHSFGQNNIDVLAGHENHSWKRKYYFVLNTDATVDGLLALSNFITNSETEGYDYDYKTESYLGRVRYNYADKYYADFSYRRDGSSKFSKDNRWGDFYSFGLNWNIKKENFLKDVNWIDALRARASYGEVGNDMAVDYYGYQALYYITKNGGNPALIKEKLAANDIKWETTQTLDFGIEGSLFNRLNFSIGYFDKRSKDLLFQVRLPLSAGSFPNDADIANLTQYKNIGTISNRGFEFSFNGDVVRSKDWTWNLSLDATTLSNKVIKLPDHADILHEQQNYSEGHSAYEWYTYHFAGVDQMTGRSLYDLDETKESSASSAGDLVEINGKKYTMSTSYAKREWAGSALPSVYGAFGSNLRWKDLSLNLLFTYSLGGKTYDASYRNLMSTASASSASALHKDVLKSWSNAPEGMTETSTNRIDPNGIPILDFNLSDDNNAVSDRWLTSSSYLIMKNITLGYNLPKALVSKWGLGGIRVKAGVENLFTITSRKGLNPQYNFAGGSDDTYVSARVFNFGLQFDF